MEEVNMLYVKLPLLSKRIEFNTPVKVFRERLKFY